MTTNRKTRPEAAGTDALLALSQLALDRMEQGVCVYDADNRIVLLNRRYLDLFNMSADVVRPGTSYRDVLAHSASLGNFPVSEVDNLYRERTEQVTAGKPFRIEQRLSNGMVLALDLKPLPEGGWMTICDDVTRLARLETQLRLQTERSQHALANMSHGLVMYDADGRLNVCNEQYLALYNLDPDIIKPGISHRDLLDHWISRGNLPGTSADEFHVNRMKEVRRKSPNTVLLTRYDGRIMQAVSRFLPDGGWVTAHEDVTDRLQYEEALKQQNFMLDAALENMAHGLCFYDSDMRLKVCNSRYREIYRLSLEETKPGTHLAELVERSMANGAFSSDYTPQQILEAARARIASRDDSPMRRHMANDTMISVRYCTLPEGGFVATYEDITERERAADELKEQYDRFNVALNNMAHGLAMLDAQMRLIVCNKRYIEMFGLSPDVVKPGVPMRDVIEHSVAIGNFRHTNMTA
ncbi:MAG: PAS-domain containing protein, partial [Bradyrhizobium guangdongense]